MKMKLLKKCCCCVSLRKGCIIIAIIDFIINITLANIGSDHLAAHIEHAVAICHCIGCLLLLSGALIVSTILLLFYLITSVTNSFILFIYSIYVIVYAIATTTIVILTFTSLVCINLYFWLVVYSYYKQLVDSYDEDDDYGADGTEV